MCRCAESRDDGHGCRRSHHGLLFSHAKETLPIRAFYLKIAVSASAAPSLPETLTLVYLPGISTGFLEINGAKAKPTAPAFVSLHRFRLAESGGEGAVFVSTDRVRAGEGTRFEVYIGEERAVAGVLLRRMGGEEEWEMECRCVAEMEGEMMVGVNEVEVRVVGVRGVLLKEKVEMPRFVRRSKRTRGRSGGRRRGWVFCSKLEKIPEERGEGEEESEDGSSDCRCSSCGGDEWELVGSSSSEAVELEGVRWAVDVGIWVVCLGVGLLVSKASSSSSVYRRKRSFLF